MFFRSQESGVRSQNERRSQESEFFEETNIYLFGKREKFNTYIIDVGDWEKFGKNVGWVEVRNPTFIICHSYLLLCRKI